MAYSMVLRQAEVRTSYFSEYLKLSGLKKEHLVCPVFVSEGPGGIVPAAMPGMTVSSLHNVVEHLQELVDRGIKSIILFGVPASRTPSGTTAMDRDGIIQKATRITKAHFGPRVTIVTDVCTCQYNTTGHCGIPDNSDWSGRGRRKFVDNDSTLDLLARIAASHAEAGSDVVAPSAMMDGQVGAIRIALQDRALDAAILSYSAKHASSLYSPFRSAAFAKSKGELDKSSYQVSYANPRQAMREIEMDIEEGADMVMIKPALAYLDLIRMAKEKFDFPLAAQNVSGEYAMIKAAGSRGYIDEEQWKVNLIGSIRRAGADKIISYFAADIADYLSK